MSPRPSSSRYCGRSLRDVTVLIAAVRLGWVAQGIFKGLLVPDVMERMARIRWLPRNVEPMQARCASLRASRRLSRWRGFDDTCLVRALVLGTLVGDQPDVALHFGFRPGERGVSDLNGHAWITIGGLNISEAHLSEGDTHGYTSAQRLSVRRH